MAAAFWKQKEEMAACVESARRKMRFSRAADRAGQNIAADRAREMAAKEMNRARYLKSFIYARRPVIR
jgi:hypothetical protein